MASTDCPDDEILAAFAERELDDDARAAVEAHVLGCRGCHETLVEFASAFVDMDDDPPEPRRERGTNIGRYLVLGTLGRGAMGVVYTAYDPDLDRRVAIKVLRALDDIDAQQRADREQRLIREARALASISHPNVITIHDVGVDAGQVFIAMELVAGRTLAAWLATGDPTPARRLDVVIAAGRGLAAAHDAGVIHRDFKPDNVLVADDGRGVWVTDFGLARVELRDEHVLEHAASVELPMPLHHTAAGALVGTPAYMALEQLRGERADARADQFSFCVVLYEAAFGERPFGGESIPDLERAIARGISSMPNGRVPRRIESALRRGLAPANGDRHADMHALLDALERGRRSSIPWMLALLGVIVLIAAAGIITTQLLGHAPVLCQDGAERVAEVWGPPQQEVLRRGFLATASPTADDDATWTASRLDDHAARWAEAHDDACRATLIDHVQAPEAMELRLECLRRASRRTAVVIESLAAADRTTLETLEKTLAELPGIESCRDVERLRERAPQAPPPALHDAVESASAELTRIELQLGQRRIAEADRAIDAITPTVGSLGFPPLGIRLETVRARLWRESKRRVEIEPLVRRELPQAIALGMTAEVVSLIDSWVAAIEGEHARQAEAQWLTALSVSIAARDDPGGWLEATATHNQAMFLSAIGRRTEAIVQVRRALEIASASNDPNPLAETSMRGLLGRLLLASQDLVRAEDELRRAVTVFEAIGAPEHVQLASKSALASALTDTHRGDEALELKRWGLAVATRDFGPRHSEVAGAATRLANSHLSLGQLDEATAWFLAAITIADISDGAPSCYARGGIARTLAYREQFDAAASWAHESRARAELELAADHPDLIHEIMLEASIESFRGNTDRAAMLAREAIDASERIHGPDAIATVMHRVGLADILYVGGNMGTGVAEEYLRALPLLRAHLPPEHFLILVPEQNLAEIYAHQRRFVDARALLENVWSWRTTEQFLPAQRGVTAMALAQVLWEFPDQRARARALAAQAEASFLAAGTDETRGYLRTLRGWLATIEDPPRRQPRSRAPAPASQ